MSTSGGKGGSGSVAAPLAAAARVLVACQSTQTNDVVWIDPATNTQAFDLAFAAAGADVTPTGLAVSSDGRIGYTTLKSIAGQAVAVFDTVTGKQIGAWIPTDLQPLSCKISPDDQTLYVLCKQAKTLIAFDTTSWARRWTANLSPAAPQSMDITPDGSLMLVTDFTGGRVYPVTLAAGVVGAAINVGANPYGIAITPDGTAAYVANNGQAAQSVSVINVATLAVTATIPGVGTAGASQPLGIRVSPDQSTVWVTCKVDSTMVPISIPANTVGAAIPVASTPYLFAISDDGRFAYVACYGLVDNVGSGFVSVVDLVNKVKITDVPTTGGNPIQVAYVRDRTSPRRLPTVAAPGQAIVPTPGSTQRDQAGYPISLHRAYAKAAAFLTENVCRVGLLDNHAAPASGTLKCAWQPLPKGLLISSITFSAGATALAGGAHQWFALLDQNLNALALTTDDLATAWGANQAKTLPLTAPFKTTYEGSYYCGLVVVATTPPTLLGNTETARGGDPPAINGDSTAGLTAPVALPFAAAPLVYDGRIIWCAVG